MSGDPQASLLTPEVVNSLINLQYGIIGRTVSTQSEPNTAGKFHFWLSRTAAETGTIEVGTIVVAYSDDGKDITFGTVDELHSFGDAENFLADFAAHRMGDAYTVPSPDACDVVVGTCLVLRNISLKAKPVGRSRVYFPSRLGIRYAFGMVNATGKELYKGASVPIGMYENGDGTTVPICIDDDFLVGPEAAHLNVAGISGLACKTSAMQFCLKSLLWHTKKNVAAVIINVKSKDLLYVDQLNTNLKSDQWSQDVYQDLGIPIEPFINARFFAPMHPQSRVSTTSLRKLHTDGFCWDLQMIYEDLPSLFHANDWDQETEGAWLLIREEIEKGKITSYIDMLNWIDKLLSQSGLTAWPKGYPTATWQKMKGQLKRFTHLYRGLVETNEEGVDIPWRRLRHENLYVIDIQMLSEGGQKLVFGRVIRAVTQLLETRSNNLDAVVVFVDELNKFAPASVRSPLKSSLVEVTARGRSLGLVLFGAEQFASAVEKEIVENSATFMFGRTETTELEAANYGTLSDEVKSKLTLLPQGRLLVKFPKFPHPIFVKFPFPPSLPGDDFREDEYAKSQESAERRPMASTRV